MTEFNRYSRGKRQAPGARFITPSLMFALAALLLQAFADAAPLPRYPIRVEQAVQALRSAALPIEGARVTLLAQLTAASEAPRLEAGSIEPWGDRRARARLRCRLQAECLPFFVQLEWPDAESARAALAALRPGEATRGGAPSAASSLATVPAESQATIPALLPGLLPASGLARGAQQVPAQQAALHAGAHATLLLDEGRVHIKLPVICLESGAPGRTVRVTALDHRQTFQAEVVDSTQLKASLQKGGN